VPRTTRRFPFEKTPPSALFEKRVVRAVARAVAKAAHERGVARRREREVQ
jgi:malic enzyme